MIKVMFRKVIKNPRNVFATYNHARFHRCQVLQSETLLKLNENNQRRIFLDRLFSSIRRLSAGHSHWKNIKETKTIKDSEKQKTSNAIVRKITVVIQMEGGQTDPKLNSQLAKVLEEGKNKDVAMTTMMQAVQRAKESKSTKGPQMFVEARVFVGCSMIVESFSDKQKWYKQSLQHVLKRYNGRTSDAGTVRHMFNYKGVVYVNAGIEQLDHDKALELAVEANAEDVVKDVDGEDEVFKFICETKELHEVKKALQAQSLKPYEARLEYLPNTLVELSAEEMELAYKLVDDLLAVEGTANVFHNMVHAS